MNEQQFTTVTVSNLPPNDLLLAMLLLVCEHAGVGFPITAAFGGTLVSGHIIPEKMFFTKLHEKMKSEAKYPAEAMRDSIKSMVDEVFKQFSDAVETGSGEKFGEALESGEYPEMIHFEDATIISADGRRTVVGLWRGRVGCIDGFSIMSF
jgi:hypothetical protein